MRTPNDRRDVVPRFGSPPWLYNGAVSIAGATVLGIEAANLTALPRLADTPMFWVVAAMILPAEIWPLATPGRPGSDSPALARTITIAVLLFWGFAVAAVVRAAAVVLVGPARHLPHPVGFAAAQVTLGL